METPYMVRFGKHPDPNIITATGTIPNKWCDVYTWRCPELMHLVIKPGDAISARLFAGGVEIAAPDGLVAIEARDSDNRIISRVFGPSNYLSVTEFSNTKERARFQIPTEIILVPKALLVVMIKDDVAMTANDLRELNFGVIETHRIGG